MKKIILLFTTLLLSSCVLANVNLSPDEDLKIDTKSPISITKPSASSKEANIIFFDPTLNLEIGQEKDLNTFCKVENVKNKELVWISSNEDIVKFIDNNGKVRALKEGEAKIKAVLKENPKIFAELIISVYSPKSVKSITVKPESKVIAIGDTLELIAEVYMQDNTINQNVRWASSDDTVATVNQSGKVSALKKGKVTIEAIYIPDPRFKGIMTLEIVESKDLIPQTSPTPTLTDVQTSPLPLVSSEPNKNTMVFKELKTGYEHLVKFNDIYSINSNIWIVGAGGQVVYSNNNGVNWSIKNISSKDLYSVYFVDQNNGWIGGDNGVLYKTTDGGNTWNLIDSTAQGFVINRINFYNPNIGTFTACSSDKSSPWTEKVISKYTQDGGNTWISGYRDQYAPYPYIEYAPDGSMVAVGTTTIFHYSGPGGVIERIEIIPNNYIAYWEGNWTRVDTQTDGLITFQTSTVIWKGGNGVIKSLDKGKTWSSVNNFNLGDEFITPIQLGVINYLKFFNQNEGIFIYLKDNSYGAIVTSNGSQTWKNYVISGIDVNSKSIKFYFNDIKNGFLLDQTNNKLYVYSSVI